MTQCQADNCNQEATYQEKREYEGQTMDDILFSSTMYLCDEHDELYCEHQMSSEKSVKL